jgi:hypothetical protein
MKLKETLYNFLQQYSDEDLTGLNISKVDDLIMINLRLKESDTTKNGFTRNNISSTLDLSTSFDSDEV